MHLAEDRAALALTVSVMVMNPLNGAKARTCSEPERAFNLLLLITDV